MTTEIKQVAELLLADRDQLDGGADDVFGIGSFNLHWRPKDSHFLLYIDKTLVSHVGVLKHTIRVANKPLLVGGIAGVLTRPEAQGRGYARALLRHALEFLAQEWKVEAALLFCLTRLKPFYEAQGWQEVQSPVLIEQPSAKIQSPLHVMVLPLNNNPWPPGDVDLDSMPWWSQIEC